MSAHNYFLPPPKKIEPAKWEFAENSTCLLYMCVYISCFAHIFFWVRDKDELTRSDGFNSIDCNPVASTAKSMFLEKRASINPHTICLEIV